MTPEQLRYMYSRVVNNLSNSGPVVFTKPEIKAAIVAAVNLTGSPGNRVGIDTAIDDALPTGNFKTTATSEQKLDLISVVRLVILESG